MRLRLHTIYWFCASLFFLSILSLSVYFLQLDYELLVHKIVTTMNKNGIEAKIRKDVLTPARFVLYRRICIAAIFILPLLFWLAIRVENSLLNRLRFIYSSLKHVIGSTANVFVVNTKRQNISFVSIMLVIVTMLVYYAFKSVLIYDEMWSYNYYTANPFYYSFFTYSTYPLYELSSHVFKSLPFDAKINLRLPSMLVGVSSCFVFYTCLKRYSGSHFGALVGLLVLAFTPMVFFYMVFARGAVFELFFAIINVFSLLNLLRPPHHKQYLIIYGIAGILGLYSAPTHTLLLCFLLVSGIWLLRSNRSLMVSFLKMHLLLVAGAFILYAPMILVSGFAVFRDLFAGQSNYHLNSESLLHYGNAILRDYSGTWFLNFIIFFASLPFLYAMRRRLKQTDNFIFVLIVVLPILPIVAYAITGVASPARSVLFGAIAFPIVFCFWAMLAEPLIPKINLLRYTMAAVLLSLLVYSIPVFYLKFGNRDQLLTKLCMLLVEKKIRSCYDNTNANSDFYRYYPGIEFYSRQKNALIYLTVNAKNSIRYKPFLPTDDYDCIAYDINATDSTRVEKYHELYRDPGAKFKIWVRNEIK